MPGMMNGKPIKTKISMALLYDPKTGRIAHVHRVVRFDPKQKETRAHVEARAKEMATRHGWDVGKLKVLHVDPTKLTKGTRYRVDRKGGKLVALTPPALPQTDDPLRLKR